MKSPLSEIFQFLELKFFIYLNRCVFVMTAPEQNIPSDTNRNGGRAAWVLQSS